MDDTESVQINAEEAEINGDEFYEKIEAPKFVDLNAPDPYHHGDDCYWFCMRVGCDQKHEEEMDSETIYKNFLLRVMAARSPNIRLRKALHKKDSSTDLKCPRTVPAKPSKPRVSRLALISSISKRIVDPKVKVKPLSKQNATPNAKAKQQPSIIAKALTTPRAKKQLSNPEAFRSVRNPKTTATAMPKNRVVAKTLVFDSPKKSVRTKSSLELNTPVKTLCAGMKKLEITSAKKQVLGYDRPLPCDTAASRKKLRGREVKSRLFDGLNLQKHKGHEAKASKSLKKSNKEETLQEIEEKMKNDDSRRVCSTSKSDEGNASKDPATTTEVVKSSMDENRVEALSDAGRSELSSRNDDDVKRFQASKETLEFDDKRHTMNSDDKENDDEVMESDDKENASASDDNRELDIKTGQTEHKILGRHDTPKDSQKISKAKSMQSKGALTAVATGGQRLKHEKPKPTNPKPFRLRTDERGILKEANLEKKLCPAPLSEITPVPKGGSSQKKYRSAIQRNERCLKQTENHNDTYESKEKETNRAHKDHHPNNRNLSLKISKEKIGRKISTPQRHTISSQQKLVASQQDCTQDKSTPKLGKSLKRIKSPSRKQLARPQEAPPNGKETISIMTTCILGTIKETSPTILKTKETMNLGESGASPGTKVSVSPASRPSLQEKRFATIPKEPNFHSIHVPRSCTRRVA
ncbi:hypothetical protein JCGZ_09882 [Jatropha curcas]|uniref:Uncharacterized protein n=1 Tax=Jatropha curcas TaxID=180498 RepID=A0A067KUF2_JATCU|nr:uncharacterized protein LOC105635987 [Jatropha curcas]KDP35910.1 hypothetical protein JCGZ_09882 [Jatropha curcas]